MTLVIYGGTKCNNDQSKSDMIGHLSNQPQNVILCTGVGTEGTDVGSRTSDLYQALSTVSLECFY